MTASLAIRQSLLVCIVVLTGVFFWSLSRFLAAWTDAADAESEQTETIATYRDALVKVKALNGEIVSIAKDARPESRNQALSKQKNLLSADLFSKDCRGNPEYDRLLATVMEGEILDQYGPLFRRLQLDDRKRAILIRLLTEQAETSLDLDSILSAKGIKTASRDERRNAIRQILLGMRGEVVNSLGETVALELDRYRQQEPLHPYLTSLQERFKCANNEISEGQLDTLISLISSEGMGNVLRGTPFSQEFLDKSATTLTQAQMAVLEDIRQERSAIYLRNEVVNKYRKKANSNLAK